MLFEILKKSNNDPMYCAGHQRYLGVKMHMEIRFEKITFQPTRFELSQSNTFPKYLLTKKSKFSPGRHRFLHSHYIYFKMKVIFGLTMTLISIKVGVLYHKLTQSNWVPSYPQTKTARLKIKCHQDTEINISSKLLCIDFYFFG